MKENETFVQRAAPETKFDTGIIDASTLYMPSTFLHIPKAHERQSPATLLLHSIPYGGEKKQKTTTIRKQFYASAAEAGQTRETPFTNAHNNYTFLFAATCFLNVFLPPLFTSFPSFVNFLVTAGDFSFQRRVLWRLTDSRRGTGSKRNRAGPVNFEPPLKTRLRRRKPRCRPTQTTRRQPPVNFRVHLPRGNRASTGCGRETYDGKPSEIGIRVEQCSPRQLDTQICVERVKHSDLNSS